MNKILVIGCTEITKVIVPMLSADPLKVSEICVASKNKEECDELKKKYKDALESFVHDYGSYHFTSTKFDDVPLLFDIFNPLFKTFL